MKLPTPAQAAWVLNGAAILCLAVSFLPLSRAAAEDDGRLRPGRTAYINVGSKTSGERITATVMLYNDGQRPVEVSSVQTSCGCTTVGEKPSAVSPGEQARLEVSIDTTGKRGPTRFMVSVHFRDAAPADAVLLADLTGGSVGGGRKP
jgi:hypothetical protein